MLTWNEKWSEAFERREPTAAARVLPGILAAVQQTSGIEKAYALLAASTCQAIIGREAEARRYLDEVRRIAPPEDAILHMHADFLDASWHSNRGEFEESLVILDRLLSLYGEKLNDPQLRYLYEQVKFSQGIALAELQKLAKARPLLEEARSFDLVEGDRALLYFHLGTTYLFLSQDYKSALGAFEEAKKIGLGENWHAAWHYYVGRSYYRLRDYASAKQEFLKAEEVMKSGLPGPESSEFYQLLAYACKGLRQSAEAEMYSQLATAGKPQPENRRFH